ncbi:hypothetical protein K488DRAFT_59981 [Vararia minispora EC-137]|uniref:Uncharacterized protein n=1 Tax=Vararia minispora EC-137 TaxID=1314806 RepID=A0ACB8Q832_9AGAM|nr:hypothetical protein K488DRAFT_59981 [Vararia minispora EC-137]
MPLEPESGLSHEPGPSTSPISIPFYYPTATLDGGGPHASAGDRARIFQELAREISIGKGKERELEPVPTLPPLSFEPARFDPEDLYPASPTTTGPSSFGSAFSAGLPSPSASHAGPSRRDPAPLAPLSRMPSRRRSLSNLSIHSTHSVTSRMKGKLRSASPARLVRRIFSKTDGVASMPVTPLTPKSAAELDLDGSASCFAPWRTRAPAATLDLNLDSILYDSQWLAAPYPLYGASSFPTAAVLLRAKGRSNSDPFPLSSVFDVVPPTLGADVFVPLEQALPSSTFMERVPRELQLQVLAFIVDLHVGEHAQRVCTGEWTALRAAKQKWVGHDQGVRELVRTGRVCKLWYSLVFDGQLWAALDLRAFPKVPASTILHIGRSAGAFVQSLHLSGNTGLQASTLEHLTNSLSVCRSPFVGETRLTTVNLAGCNALTTAALHYLLDRSPALVSLNVRGLLAVTNETCEVLARACPCLTVLNMSRCKSLSGLGIRLLTANALRDGSILALKDLRLSGMKGVTDGVLEDLGQAAPDLEVLDLSYCRDLHNSSLGAFVACMDDSNLVTTVVLSAREAGRDPSTGIHYRRRVTRLRHLSLSSCLLLTDDACANLAHAVPDLELLELAAIGTELKDDGLVLLLGTVPKLRKLDLEDAFDITDKVLQTLTQTGGTGPGRALEHLVISSALGLSNDAMLSFMRACPRLRVLEADSTRLSGATSREFVALARARATRDAVLVAVDCRAVGESVAKELTTTTRPRLGWRAYSARRLSYLDGADPDTAGLGVGQDECEPSRVVFKTFFGWQTVDAVTAARQKRKRNRREANASGETAASTEGDDIGTGSGTGRARWWAPGARRSSAAMLEMGTERDSCIVM